MPEWIQSVDDRVLQWFQERHTTFLDHSLTDITALGGPNVLALAVLLALGLLLLYGMPKRAVLLVALALGVYFATEVVKDAVARHRPVLEAPGKAKKKARAAAKGGDEVKATYSFPSSHASRSMAVFLALALCLRRRRRSGPSPRAFPYALAWALILTGLVGVSRLYLGKHFLSDVVGGWLLGLLFGVLFYLADRGLPSGTGRDELPLSAARGTRSDEPGLGRLPKGTAP